jgi:adenylylsulfate kinase
MTKGVTVWFTGLSGAGKSTIVNAVEAKLREQGYPVEVLDGDIVRTWLSQGLGFSRADRDTNVRRVGFVANLLSRNGVITLVSMISPYRDIRDEIRGTTQNFVEVYVSTSLEVCEQRDVKGLYARARSGEIKEFTGISDPYEAPLNPEIICQTEGQTIEASCNQVLSSLEQLGYLKATVGGVLI